MLLLTYLLTYLFAGVFIFKNFIVYFVYDLHIDISLFIHQHAGRSCTSTGWPKKV